MSAAGGSISASLPPSYQPSGGPPTQTATMQQQLPLQQTASTSTTVPQPATLQAVQEMALNGQHLVRALRAGVQKTLQQITAGPQGDGADAQQVFFAENKKRLTTVHEHYELLETLSKQMPKLTPTNTIIDRLGKLLQEGQVDVDSDQLYLHLLDAVNWNETNSQLLLFVNKFLRGYCRKRPSLMTPKLIAPSAVGAQNPPQHGFYMQLQSVIKDRRFNMPIEFIEKSRSSAVIEIVIGHMVESDKRAFSPTFKLLLLVNNAVPEMIQVKAFNEEWGYIDGQVDLFDESKHLVHRRITAQMNSQIMQLFTPGVTELRDGNALQVLLTWFARYGTIFDQPCRQCKKVLKDFVPPTFVDMRVNMTAAPLHETCR